MVEKNWEDNRSSGGVLLPRSNKVCLNDREVEDFLFRRLSGVTREAVEEHLLCCQSCLSRVEEEQKFASALRVAGRRLENEEMDRALGLRRFGIRQRLAGWLLKPAPIWGSAVALCAILLILAAPWNGVRPSQEIALNTVRGTETAGAAQARSGGTITLRVDLTELVPQASYQLDLVDSQRRLRASAELKPAQGQLVWGPLPSLAAGQYWIRLSGAAPERELLREYGLAVR
jgi:hypothetical protein